jgi:hypothetical protein
MEHILQLTPEQNSVITKALEKGMIKTPEESIELGLERLRGTLKPEAASKRKLINLVELLENSPLKGVELNIERDQSPGREVEF